MKKISVKKIRDLNSVRAASGLVKIDGKFFVIADDDLSLAVFSLEPGSKDLFFPLSAGDLPTNHLERKKVKPDWEALVKVPPKYSPGEWLLVIPSGSKVNRQQGFYLSVQDLKFAKSINANQPVDFTEIYEKLGETFTELNIEGACFTDSGFLLFQRGNGKSNQSALIELDAQEVIDDIKNQRPVQASWCKSIKHYDLGLINDCPLSFTDAFNSQDTGVWFLAAAEKTDSTYEDGAFCGSVLGRIDDTGQFSERYELDCPTKPEGLWVEKESDGYRIYLVTDADDPEKVASLYTAVIAFC